MSASDAGSLFLLLVPVVLVLAVSAAFLYDIYQTMRRLQRQLDEVQKRLQADAEILSTLVKQPR
jgi:CHASE3 domain sensor protein